jgi:hypothetical protein
MEILELRDEQVKLIEGTEGLPQIKKFKSKIMQRKKFFDDSLCYIFYMHSRKSVFRGMLPKERKQKIFDTFFPSRKIGEFEASAGFDDFVKWYLDFTKTYKEKMYSNHLADIETMAENISKISFTKKKRIIRTIKVKVGKDWFDADVDTELEVDNTEEKLAAMDLMTRLIEKEEYLKKKIQEEYIKDSKKQQERRLFDITT